MSSSATSQSTTAKDVISAIRREHMFDKFPRTGATKELVLDMARQHGVQFVDMQFTDILGTLKAVTIPVHKLEDALNYNVWFDGSSIEGFTRITESDMYLKPDFNTFAVLPWTKQGTDVTARLICDVYLPDGQPFEGDPRGILKRQLEEVRKLGYIFQTGPELEFFLFQKDANGKLAPLPHDTAGYFDQTTDLALNIRREMAFGLDEMGIEVEALHHEVAAGQHEIDFKYADALTTADNAMSLKLTLKAIAQRFGLHATFMPKPIFGVNGSGMHVHQSFARITDGTNAFYEKDGLYGLADMAKHYLAGQIKHIKAMNAVMNPTINSYKRLVVGYEAPVNAAWGQRNRSALIRIPRVTPATAHKATRLELRCPDPAANPYLTFAVMLAAGLDGLRNKLPAPPPVEENIWHLTEKEMKKRKITTVATNLEEALECLKGDEVLRAAVGEHFFTHFYEAKKAEIDQFRLHVTDWELQKYLEVY